MKLNANITKEEVITTITTIAKYLAMWDNDDVHLVPRVATILSFADYVNTYGYAENIAEVNKDMRDADYGINVDDTTFWLLLTTMSSLMEEAIHGTGYTDWIDDVKIGTYAAAKDLVNKVR